MQDAVGPLRESGWPCGDGPFGTNSRAVATLTIHRKVAGVSGRLAIALYRISREREAFANV